MVARVRLMIRPTMAIAAALLAACHTPSPTTKTCPALANPLLQYEGTICPVSWRQASPPSAGDSHGTFDEGRLDQAWPADAPVGTHVALYLGWQYWFDAAPHQRYLDFATGVIYSRDNGAFEYSQLLQEDSKYLGEFEAMFGTLRGYLGKMDDITGGELDLAHMAGWFAVLQQKYGMVPDYEIPQSRLRFSGKPLHWSPIRFKGLDSASGQQGADWPWFIIGLGAHQAEYWEDTDAWAGQYTLQFGSDYDFVEFNLETGEVRGEIGYDPKHQSKGLKPETDPAAYLEFLKTAKALHDRVLLGVATDTGNPWMYGDLPLVLESSAYLGYCLTAL